MKIRRPGIGFAAVLASMALLGGSASAQEAPKPVPGLDKIRHIIVLYLENRSFDNLYGLFPGAEGISDAGAAAIQVDRDGRPYDKLPPVRNTEARDPETKQPIVDTRFPSGLPNGPFRSRATPFTATTKNNCRSTAARWTSTSLGPTPAASS